MIYLDNAATTKLLPEALEAMMPYLTEVYGNPGAVHSFGVKARSAINRARVSIAESINANRDEIYFTSGGSEADNWAVEGIAHALSGRGKHIITTSVEHHAVLNTCRKLEKEGFEVTYLSVNKDGTLSFSRLQNAIRNDTILISIMAANNEIGTIYPISEIGELARSKGIVFHTDAVQAYGQIPIDVAVMKVDLLSASAHKFHGPKGTGFLYIREGVLPANLINGGGQERSRRAGTENVAGIVGMGVAAKHATDNLLNKMKCETEMRDYFISRVLSEIEGSALNGSATERLPGNINIMFAGIKSDTVLIKLDIKNICASAGAACTSSLGEPSHVLQAIGLSAGEAESSLRFSLSEFNTKEEIDTTIVALKEIVESLNKLLG